jgi:hypothetical protein
MSADEFPHLLNARDADGRIVYADGYGRAYIVVPDSEETGPGPRMPKPSGWFPGVTKYVERPESMRDPFFDEHAGGEIYTNAERTECRITFARGNPPYPPRRVALPPSLRGA